MSGDVSFGFKARVISELFAWWNAMYIPCDPPPVLQIANLLMISIVGQQFKTMVEHHHLLVHSPSPGLELNPGHATTALCWLAFKSNLIKSNFQATVELFMIASQHFRYAENST